jgi:uncharacterized protein YbjT (DUF2867 family)
MKMLVTGGAGFIGSHYVRSLLSGSFPGYEGAAVTVLDKLMYAGNIAKLEPVAGYPALTFVRGDIADPVLVSELLPGHDVVCTSPPSRTSTVPSQGLPTSSRPTFSERRCCSSVARAPESSGSYTCRPTRCMGR